jgi:transposase InsO family protein
MTRGLRWGFGLALVAFGGTPAFADKIDGDWCAADGRHFFIDGPKIVTERGQTVQGDYRRHYFSYAIPEPAKDAGQVVRMALLDEFDVDVTAGDATVERWKRCSPTS